MVFAFKPVSNYTGNIKTSSGLSSFISQAKISLNNSQYTNTLNNYVSSLPATSLKAINTIQASDSVKKILENATKGITDITNGLKASVVQQALTGLNYEASKQLESLGVVTQNTLKSTTSEELQKQLMNDAITGVNTLKTNTLNLVNEIVTAPELEKTKIINVTLNKLQTQLLKDQGYSGTVLISKMTLPEGQMYFKTEDLQKKPELLKTLLSSGKVTQEQLASGGVPTKSIMSEYMEYMSEHPSESSIYPVLPQTTTIKQGNIATEKKETKITTKEATYTPTKGKFDTTISGITPATFDGIVSKEDGKYKVDVSVKDGKNLKQEYVYFTDKNKAIEYAEKEFAKDDKNTSVGVVEVGKETLVIYGASGFGAGAPTTAAKITYDMGNGGKLVSYVAKENPIYAATLKDAQTKGAKIENAIVAPVASVKSTLSSEGVTLVNKLLGLTGAKLTVDSNLATNLLEIKQDTTPLSTNIEQASTIKGTEGKWFWETWEVEGTPTVVSQVGNWLADRIMTPEYSAERAGLITIGQKSALNIGDILTLNDKSGKANIFAPILNIIDWSGSSSISVTEKGKQVNDLFASKLKEGKSIGELLPGISEDTAKYTFLTTATPVQLAQVTQTIEGLHQINYMASDPTLGHATLAAFGPTVIENAQAKAPLTYKEAGNLQGKYLNSGIEALVSPKMTGDPVIDLIASPFTVLNADVGAVAKAWKEVGLISRLDKGITGVSKATAIASTLFVPTTEVGWIAKASDVGIKEVLEGGKLTDWKPLSVVQDISKSFEKAVDNPINSKIFVDSIVKTDITTIKSTLAELISKDPVAISNVIETGIKLSDEATGTAVKAILKDANNLFVDTSLAFAKEISTTAVGDSTVAGKLLFDAGEKLGRTPVENMVTTALEHGTENYNLITNALEEMKKLDIQGAVSIPTTSVSGATRAISGAELELVNVMPESVADKIVRYSGTSELRKINNVEDIAKLNVDEIKYLTTEKGITKSDLEKYITKAKEILNPTEAVTKIEDYTKTTDFYKRWNTIEEQKMKEFGITQTETSKLNDKGEQVIELRYGFNTKTINKLSDKEFTSLMRNNRSLLTQVMEQSDLAEIEKLGISTKRKAEIKAEFWNELTGTAEKMEKAKLVTPSSDINELYDIRTALMDNKEAIELTYAKQLKEEGKATIETLSSVKRAREAVNNVDALIEIKKTQIEKATTTVIEIEQIKETLKPGKATPKEAATNAIAQLKKGNIEDAAKAMAESSIHKQTVLLAGKNANNYADTSITKILRMTNEGAPETLVNQMAKERSQYALETLSKKSNDMKKTAFKISEGMPLNSDELKTLWLPENRELAFDAMWHEKNPTSLTDELVKDALTRNNADELAQLKKEMQEELTACINRGECV